MKKQEETQITCICKENEAEIEYARWIKYFNTETFEVIVRDEDPGEPFVEVDDNIGWVIAELNRKGYKTCFSCEGHYTDFFPYTEEEVKAWAKKGLIFSPFELPYIAFAPGIKLPNAPDKWDLVHNPNAFDENGNPLKNFEETIYANIQDSRIKGEESFTVVKFRRLAALMKWVKGLECIASEG